MGAMKQLLTGMRTIPVDERGFPIVLCPRPGTGRYAGPYVLEDPSGRRVASGRRVRTS